MENTNKKLYLGTDGKYYNEYELMNAYFLCTGRIFGDENQPANNIKMFECWVHDLIGLSIEKIVNADDVTYEDFLRHGQKLLAVKAYRERNQCSLAKAKEYIDSLIFQY